MSAAGAGSSNGSGVGIGNDSPTRLDATTLEPPPTTRQARGLKPSVRIPPPHENDKPDVKLGVLLLQLGGPERTEDVEGFLYNLFADPGALRLRRPCLVLASLVEFPPRPLWSSPRAMRLGLRVVG